MNVQLQLLQTSAKDAAVAEDAFMTISSLILGELHRGGHPLGLWTDCFLCLQSWMSDLRSTPVT